MACEHQSYRAEGYEAGGYEYRLPTAYSIHDTTGEQLRAAGHDQTDRAICGGGGVGAGDSVDQKGDEQCYGPPVARWQIANAH